RMPSHRTDPVAGGDAIPAGTRRKAAGMAIREHHTETTGRRSDLAGLEDADAPAGHDGLADPTGPGELAAAVAVEWANEDADALEWDRLYVRERRRPTGRRRQKARKRSEHSGGALPPGAIW